MNTKQYQYLGEIRHDAGNPTIFRLMPGYQVLAVTGEEPQEGGKPALCIMFNGKTFRSGNAAVDYLKDSYANFISTLTKED